MTDYAAIAHTLTTAADALDHNPSLDAGQALRQAAPDPDLYDEATSAILTAADMRGHDISSVPRRAAIVAARAEAARYGSYGSSR